MPAHAFGEGLLVAPQRFPRSFPLGDSCHFLPQSALMPTESTSSSAEFRMASTPPAHPRIGRFPDRHSSLGPRAALDKFSHRSAKHQVHAGGLGMHTFALTEHIGVRIERYNLK